MIKFILIIIIIIIFIIIVILIGPNIFAVGDICNNVTHPRPKAVTTITTIITKITKLFIIIIIFIRVFSLSELVLIYYS